MKSIFEIDWFLLLFLSCTTTTNIGGAAENNLVETVICGVIEPAEGSITSGSRLYEVSEFSHYWSEMDAVPRI